MTDFTTEWRNHSISNFRLSDWRHAAAVVSSSVGAMVRLPSVRLTRSERRDAFSHRLLWLGFEVHYLAHLVVCRIGRIQPDHPPLSTFNIGKESPMSRATTVAEFVELNRG